MNACWRSQDDHLLCRWTESGASSRYDSAWIKDALSSERTAGAPLIDLTRASLLGAADWFGYGGAAPRHSPVRQTGRLMLTGTQRK
jgi:hypothetical protein